MIAQFFGCEPAMAGKWLELLKEIAPRVVRVSAIFDRSAPSIAEFTRTAENVAPSLHLQYVSAPVSNAKDVQEAIQMAAWEPSSGLAVFGGTVSSANRETIVRLVAQHRMPAIYPFRYWATSGGLLAYSVDSVDLFRRAATYVDRILKGAKAADLRVQRPTKYELVINLKTANALGLTVPPTLLAIADEVIE
jgi:putative ABC transport system substrate-binding protein